MMDLDYRQNFSFYLVHVCKNFASETKIPTIFSKENFVFRNNLQKCFPCRGCQ